MGSGDTLDCLPHRVRSHREAEPHASAHHRAPLPPPHRHALIEKQNRITHNDRHPLMTGWTFCDFLKRYNRPEHENMLYTVTPLSEAGSTLRRFLWLPEPLRCSHY